MTERSDIPGEPDRANYASRRYSSPTDGLARAITITLIVTAAGAILLFGFMPRFNQIISGIFLAFSGLTLFLAYSFHPLGYGLSAAGMTIYLPWRHIRIPWETVTEIEVEPREKPYGSIRTIGSGGVFGYLGRYWSPALGFHFRLVTDRRNAVVLYRRIPYCISPDDPDRFVREARSFLGGDTDSTEDQRRGRK